MWAQVGPGKYARKDSSSGVSAQPSSHNQPVMSRSDIISLIDTRVAETLSQQMSLVHNTELNQQPFSDVNSPTTVKELHDEFRDFKKSILKRLEDNEVRLENLNQRCDRMEKSASDEQRSLNTSFNKLQQEFRDGSTKLTKRFEDVEGNLKSMVKKEIENQCQRDNPHQNKLQNLTLENMSKMQTTQSTAGFERTFKGGKIGTWSREPESDDEFDAAGVGLTEKPVRDRDGVQSPTDFGRMTQKSQIRNAERNLESLVEYEQVKELGLKSNNKSEMHVNKAKNVSQSTSPASQVKKDVKGNQFTNIPNESFSRDADRLKSLDSRLEGDLTENQFIKIPIAVLSRGDAEQLMSLDSRLEDDLTENQFIKIPIAALSRGDAEQLMSLDSRLEDDLTENQFIKIPIAALSREDAEQLMSLDSRLVHF